MLLQTVRTTTEDVLIELAQTSSLEDAQSMLSSVFMGISCVHHANNLIELGGRGSLAIAISKKRGSQKKARLSCSLKWRYGVAASPCKLSSSFMPLHPSPAAYYNCDVPCNVQQRHETRPCGVFEENCVCFL